MALFTTKGAGNIPEDGIRLSKAEALVLQKNTIKKWKSLTDVVFLEYGWLASSAVTFTSSIYLTRMIRSLLNINSQLRFLPYLVTAVAPSILSGAWTEKRVTEKVLLMTTRCPMCLQLEFGVAQMMLGILLPISSSFAMHLPVAYHYNTFALPDIREDTRQAYKLCFKLLRSRALQVQVVAALQIPIVFLLPYLQTKQLDNIHRTLYERN